MSRLPSCPICKSSKVAEVEKGKIGCVDCGCNAPKKSWMGMEEHSRLCWYIVKDDEVKTTNDKDVAQMWFDAGYKPCAIFSRSNHG